jgi:hypothetical protein
MYGCKHGIIAFNRQDILLITITKVMGVTAWWHGWSQDEVDKLAGSLMAGHLIECGCYVVCLLFPQSSMLLLRYLGCKTGGNFGGFQKLTTRYYDLSYPIAAIAADGTSVIQKHLDQNGM